jgi:hypothetical protein
MAAISDEGGSNLQHRTRPDQSQPATVTGRDDIAPIRGYVWAVVFSFAFYAVGLNVAFVLWWLLP